MKTLRTLLALAFATALAGSVAFAEADATKPEVKAEKAPCGCVVGDNKKVCGVDKDCCCTGEKAKGKEAAADKKADKKACCADEKCADGKCKAEDKKACAVACETCK